jgi:Flp pilus assembly secretin CpaC
MLTMNADGIVLSGRASNTQVMLRIGEIVRAAQPKANVINMLQVPGGSDAQQVMLQVRIAEVNRKALSELGTTLFTGPTYILHQGAAPAGAVSYRGKEYVFRMIKHRPGNYYCWAGVL